MNFQFKESYKTFFLKTAAMHPVQLTLIHQFLLRRREEAGRQQRKISLCLQRRSATENLAFFNKEETPEIKLLHLSRCLKSEFNTPGLKLFFTIRHLEVTHSTS